MRRSRALPAARLLLATVILLAATGCVAETKNIGGPISGFSTYLQIHGTRYVGHTYPGEDVELHLVYESGSSQIEIEWTLGTWADPPSLTYTDSKFSLRQTSTSFEDLDTFRTIKIVEQGLTEPLEVEARCKVTLTSFGSPAVVQETSLHLCLLPSMPPEPTFEVLTGSDGYSYTLLTNAVGHGVRFFVDSSIGLSVYPVEGYFSDGKAEFSIVHEVLSMRPMASSPPDSTIPIPITRMRLITGTLTVALSYEKSGGKCQEPLKSTKRALLSCLTHFTLCHCKKA